MTTYANVGHILLKRGNTTQSTGYTGPLGELTYDTDLGTVRVHNGNIAGGVNILATQAQVDAINSSISTITGIDAIFVANINLLLANTAVQSLAIGNLQAFQTYANATFGTSSFGNADVADYLSSQNITSANIGAYQTYANVTFSTVANAASQASDITTLYANAATQATSLTTLTTNAAAQATDITNLWSNAATQSSAITTLQGQVGQTYGNANVAAYLAVGLNTANTSSNTNTLATTAFVQNILPTGGIIMWSGASTAIPYGWHLCDGTNSTPDLRGQFIIGAGGTYAVGATGGSANAIVVSHSHSVTDAGHNHSYSYIGTTGGQVGQNMGLGNYSTGTTNVAVTGVTINSTGSNGTNANLPPYYALCYIMKVI